MPDTVNQLMSKLDHVISQNDRPTEMMLKQQEMINALQELHVECKTAVMTHDIDMKRAISRVIDPNVDSEDEVDADEVEEEDADYSGTLLIGDNLLRNVQPTCDSLTIESLSEAGFSDLKKSLKKISPKQRRFERIVIVCGANDVTTKKSADRIARDCQNVLHLAKERAQQVHLKVFHVLGT